MSNPTPALPPEAEEAGERCGGIEGGKGGETDGDRLEDRDRGEGRLNWLGGDVREW